ncbi:MAG: PqqD family protein [Deltaproteobacteria bacterium]|nr:PqqD family protein [Deltaproteobacteria bacterium]
MRLFKKKPKRPVISRAEALNRIPSKNLQIREERLDNGEMVIHYPVTIRPFFAGLVKRFGGSEAQIQTRKLELDGLGTSVWAMIDGNCSVRQLISIFATTHQLEAREAEVAVTQFLRELGRRGLIGMR